MRFRKRRRDKSTSAFEVTPLVDIMFLMQIFFLLTLGSPLKINEVSLPQSMSGAALTKKAVTVAVSINEIFIDNQSAQENDLKALPFDTDIVILASKDIPYFRVIAMLDILKTSGHERISLATKPIKH